MARDRLFRPNLCRWVAIFALSDFPPTQRFGLVILFGLIIDILANLFVLPLLGGAALKKRD